MPQFIRVTNLDNEWPPYLTSPEEVGSYLSSMVLDNLEPGESSRVELSAMVMSQEEYDALEEWSP